MKTIITKSAKAGEVIEKRGLNAVSSVDFVPANEAEMKAIAENYKEGIPDGFVAGWASTADLDSYGHIMQAGCLQTSIQKRGLVGPKGIKLLLNHNSSKVAGAIRKLEYRGDKLWIEAELNLNISYARDAYEAAKMVGGLSFSVGFYLEAYEVKKDVSEDEYLLITSGDLFEISIVPFAGNEEAVMTFVKGQKIEPPETLAAFEKMIVAYGLVKNRSDAMRLTQVVKVSTHLFSKAQEETLEVVTEEEPEAKVTETLVPVANMNSLKELMAKAKALV